MTLPPGSSRHLVASRLLDDDVEVFTWAPPGHDPAHLPIWYLLHGRDASGRDWADEAFAALANAVERGQMAPFAAVAPSAAWPDVRVAGATLSGAGSPNARSLDVAVVRDGAPDAGPAAIPPPARSLEAASWWVDSQFDGGRPVETVMLTEVLPQIEATLGGRRERGRRGVAGYSMGGSGALRYAFAHQELFSHCLALSPAVHLDLPPRDSGCRAGGGYGVRGVVFEAERYRELGYPRALRAFDPAMPLRLFIAVGDEEWANPAPDEAECDLDFEAARLYNRARRVPGIAASLRVYGGGHDWEVWRRGLLEGLADWTAHGLTTTAQVPSER